MQRDNGPKLAEAAPEGSIERPQPGPNGFYIASLGPNGFPARIPGVPGVCVLGNGARAQWYRITVTELSNNLISRAGKPIEDATGLKGLYDALLGDEPAP